MLRWFVAVWYCLKCRKKIDFQWIKSGHHISKRNRMKGIIIPPVLAFVFLILTVSWFFVFPALNLIPFPFNLSGIIVCLTGLTIMGKTKQLFKKYQTTMTFKKSTFIIRDGVFSKTRNPVYISMFLLLLGLGICMGNIVSVITPFLFIILSHFLFVLKEEKLMYQTFGQKYLDYKTKVKRWI